MSTITFSSNPLFQENRFSDAEKLFAEGREKWPAAFSEHYFKPEQFKEAHAFIESLEKAGCQALVVIGMGGSSLGAKAIQQFMGPVKPRVFFLEGPHPSVFARLKQKLKNKNPAILFISKSGSTLESRTQLELARQHFAGAPEYFITSNEDKIADLKPAPGHVFHIPAPLGGRFSVVSPVGMLPGLFMGADMADFLEGFMAGLRAYGEGKALAENPAKQFSVQLASLLNQKYQGMVIWLYCRELLLWGEWLQQLWGESVGKNEKVTALPFLCKGPEDQHSLLQFFLDGPNLYAHVFMSTDDYREADFTAGDLVAGDFQHKNLSEILQAQKESIALALNENGRPLCQFSLNPVYEDGEANMFLLGKLMCFFMFVTTYSGYLYGVNPFDQPAVEKGKVYCKKLLQNEKVSSPFKNPVTF